MSDRDVFLSVVRPLRRAQTKDPVEKRAPLAPRPQTDNISALAVTLFEPEVFRKYYVMEIHCSRKSIIGNKSRRSGNRHEATEVSKTGRRHFC